MPYCVGLLETYRLKEHTPLKPSSFSSIVAHSDILKKSCSFEQIVQNLLKLQKTCQHSFFARLFHDYKTLNGPIKREIFSETLPYGITQCLFYL
jgi:hypothetical protein